MEFSVGTTSIRRDFIWVGIMLCKNRSAQFITNDFPPYPHRAR
jgi:hypothetical protein